MERPQSDLSDDTPKESTPEERLLDALLSANEELLEVLRMYHDLELLAIERMTEERSKKDIWMDQSVSMIVFVGASRDEFFVISHQLIATRMDHLMMPTFHTHRREVHLQQARLLFPLQSFTLLHRPTIHFLAYLTGLIQCILEIRSHRYNPLKRH
jgi:hypothetical protein